MKFAAHGPRAESLLLDKPVVPQPAATKSITKAKAKKPSAEPTTHRNQQQQCSQPPSNWREDPLVVLVIR